MIFDTQTTWVGLRRNLPDPGIRNLQLRDRRWRMRIAKDKFHSMQQLSEQYYYRPNKRTVPNKRTPWQIGRYMEKHPLITVHPLTT